VLYSARHDFGTRVLQKTGNLAAVMRVTDPRIAMHYQHPDLDRSGKGSTRAMRLLMPECRGDLRHILRHTNNRAYRK
jgi:hypothetical protein